jgi:hypothetical protein
VLSRRAEFGGVEVRRALDSMWRDCDEEKIGRGAETLPLRLLNTT